MKDLPAFAVPNKPGPAHPVLFDPAVCDGCNRCVEICTHDILIPSPDRGRPPIVLYPEECWDGGDCVAECPHPGAIRLNPPLMQRVRWKRKTTGEHFRL
jgi:NAD-dependent dihydropyrimidine dehydrogenase PreA subunit